MFRKRVSASQAEVSTFMPSQVNIQVELPFIFLECSARCYKM